MRRLVPPSRSEHDPLAGRQWKGYKTNDLVTIDEQTYKFYRHDANRRVVEVAELDTRILWQFDETYFEIGATHG